MRRLLTLALALCLACLPLASCTSQEDGHGPHAGGSGRERSYAYGSGPNQRLVAYEDTAAPGIRQDNSHAYGGRHPAVVILHGGFWFRPQPPPPNPWALRIAASGAVVFDVDYRRNLDAPWPAQRSDVLRALRWIRRRAGLFDVDTHRVVLLGSSAGGQIATNIGTYGAGRKLVAGVVALSPVVDPYLAWRIGASPQGDDRKALAVRTNATLLAGCVPRSGAGIQRVGCRRVWRDMDAASHASGRDDAPMLLIHSRHDFVHVGNSRLLREAELRKGMPSRDLTVGVAPGGAHGSELMGVPGVAPRVLKWIEDRTRD